MKKIIYDVGANNGDDIPYYLMKGDIVIAIEANPVLCESIRQRFVAEIQAGQLIIESCVVTANEGTSEVDFYVHNTNHVLSQLPMPSAAVIDQFTRFKLPSKSILSIIQSHGSPYYIKIDIEYYDAPLLRAIFAGEIRPPFISAESHSIEVFLTLAEQGRYQAFKLVDGSSVSHVYTDRAIESQFTPANLRYSFPYHSAGPFGNDIDGEWMTADNFFRLLAFEGLGWKDIHATNTEDPDPAAQPRVANYLDRLINRDELLSYIGNRVKSSFLIGLNGLLGRRS
jgi:FkbM family methyltransferase